LIDEKAKTSFDISSCKLLLLIKKRKCRNVYKRTSGGKAIFPPPTFFEKITWLESALNSEQNHVFFFEKNFALVPAGTKKKFFFPLQFDLVIGYRPC
jgi:hypothetical protein